jgi:hypothetical protein
MAAISRMMSSRYGRHGRISFGYTGRPRGADVEATLEILEIRAEVPDNSSYTSGGAPER